MSSNNKSNCKKVEEIKETAIKQHCELRTIDLLVACGALIDRFPSHILLATINTGTGHAERTLLSARKWSKNASVEFLPAGKSRRLNISQPLEFRP